MESSNCSRLYRLSAAAPPSHSHNRKGGAPSSPLHTKMSYVANYCRPCLPVVLPLASSVHAHHESNLPCTPSLSSPLLCCLPPSKLFTIPNVGLLHSRCIATSTRATSTNVAIVAAQPPPLCAVATFARDPAPTLPPLQLHRLCTPLPPLQLHRLCYDRTPLSPSSQSQPHETRSEAIGKSGSHSCCRYGGWSQSRALVRQRIGSTAPDSGRGAS